MINGRSSMIMYIHFTVGDNLWSLRWALTRGPSTAEATAGTGVGPFMLEYLEQAVRWLVAKQSIMERHRHTRSGDVIEERSDPAIIADPIALA